ncbi:MAG: transglutaminase domain-containing protein [Bacteroidetes bacterium]|nr:transglutaminase domain-containing protein [Bacteroidota bacterium]
MRTFSSTVITFLFLLLATSIQAQLIKDKAILANMAASLSKQKLLAGGRSHQLFDVLSRPMKPDEKQALEYLYAYMPLSDLADYNGDFFDSQVTKTLQARYEMPWGSKVPEDVFLHFVLPIRVNNENLDNFRVLMYDELKERIKGKNMHDAALEINHWCHEKVTYKASDERTSSPLATIKTSFGRCGEESTFTVSAMRMMGIPARQVYTPRWAHCDDNHAWVEVWVDGKWFFLGACEPEPELNMGWFAGPAMRAMLVHTRAFGWYNGTEPVIDREEKFSELNLIRNYAETKTIYIRVLNESGKPVKDATVEYQLYNYAEFYPIAKGKTNEQGVNSITTGLGDLLIWANSGDSWGYRKITVEETDTLTLNLSSHHENVKTENFDLVPPVEKAPPVTGLSKEIREHNNLMLQKEDSIRTAYMTSFKDSAWAVELAKKLNLDPGQTVTFIRESYGNWKEISSFLESALPAQRVWAMNLLASVSEKDLRDAPAETLLDHLTNSVPFESLSPGVDSITYSNYVLSGRISNEMMLPWRGFLQQQLTTEFITSVHKDIHSLISWIKDNIALNDTANLHSRSPLSPRGVYELRVADSRSRDIFFVAICHCLGIPARINPATYLPQYWSKGEWINVNFKQASKQLLESGHIHFVNLNPHFDPKYAINFTIARFQDGVYRTVDLDFGKGLSEFPARIEVNTGSYYLVTGNRQADGSVLSSLSFFSVPVGQDVEVDVNIREDYVSEKPLGQIDLKSIQLEKFNSSEKLLASKIAQTKGAIFIWLDPDKEPSKHILADLPAVASLLQKWNGELIFILNKATLSSSFNPSDISRLSFPHSFCFDASGKFLKDISKIKGYELMNNLPVVVVSDPKGNLLYVSEGYKIGIGEQLAKVIARMKQTEER